MKFFRKVCKTLLETLEKIRLRWYINKWLAGFVLIAAVFLCADYSTVYRELSKRFFIYNFLEKVRQNMAQRKDIHKILIIGSGPIIIGQACEFD